MALSNTLAALRAALVQGERVGRLAERIESELEKLRFKAREPDRRVSRIEGALAMLDRLEARR